MEKNITEETVKVRVMFEQDAVDLLRNIDFCSIWLLLPENSQFLEERGVGDPGNSCKYNLFINDSGCRVIKVALSQQEGVFFSWACLLFKVNTDLGDIYCMSSALECIRPGWGFIWELCVQMEASIRWEKKASQTRRSPTRTFVSRFGSGLVLQH